jgi:hypothetical protein
MTRSVNAVLRSQLRHGYASPPDRGAASARPWPQRDGELQRPTVSTCSSNARCSARAGNSGSRRTSWCRRIPSRLDGCISHLKRRWRPAPLAPVRPPRCPDLKTTTSNGRAPPERGPRPGPDADSAGPSSGGRSLAQKRFPSSTRTHRSGSTPSAPRSELRRPPCPRGKVVLLPVTHHVLCSSAELDVDTPERTQARLAATRRGASAIDVRGLRTGRSGP